MKVKKQVIKIKCLKCKHKFNRRLGPESTDKVTCPKCGGTKVDLA